jgi:hypothetical protein
MTPLPEPTEEQLHRAVGAFLPFVRSWDLSLNPEDCWAIAYAILRHANSDCSWEELDADVENIVEEENEKKEQLTAFYRTLGEKKS